VGPHAEQRSERGDVPGSDQVSGTCPCLVCGRCRQGVSPSVSTVSR
jgi:hypothetical protein